MNPRPQNAAAFCWNTGLGLGPPHSVPSINPGLSAGTAPPRAFPIRDCRNSPICAQSQSGSSTCSWPAARVTSTRSTTNRTMRDFHGKELPDSVRQGQRLTGMTSGRSRSPASRRCSNSNASESTEPGSTKTFCRTPPGIVDDITIIKSMHTEAVNHDPAITYINTESNSRGNRLWGPGSATDWAAKTTTCPPTS